MFVLRQDFYPTSLLRALEDDLLRASFRYELATFEADRQSYEHTLPFSELESSSQVSIQSGPLFQPWYARKEAGSIGPNSLWVHHVDFSNRSSSTLLPGTDCLSRIGNL